MDEKTCLNTVCVSKCCPEGDMIDFEEFGCIKVPKGGVEWKPDFVENVSSTIISGMPLCEEKISFDYEDTPNGRFSLLENGSLSLPVLNTSYSAKEYCLDYYFMDKPILTALVCLRPDVEGASCPNMATIHAILLLVSCVFLLVTLIVYMIVPDLRRSLYARCLMCQVVTLLVGFIGVVTSVFAFGNVSDTSCKVIGVVTYLGLISAFFWMNVLCFDMWSSFRNMLPPKGSSYKRFAWMNAYVWGSTFVLGLAVVVMTWLPETEATSHLILPGFGINNCWFGNEKSKWIYFYSVVAIIQVLNLFFFLHVAGILIKAQIDHSRILTNASSKKHKARMWIYLKLFIIMGIGWLSEVATSLQYNSCYFLFLDTINAMQGFFIFFVLICKLETFKKIEERVSTVRRSIHRLTGHVQVPLGEVEGDGKEQIKMKKRTLSESSTSCTLSISEY